MNETTPPQNEVLEFWGRPSKGTFRRVAVVQDAVVLEPVTSGNFDSIRRQVESVAGAYPSIQRPVDLFPDREAKVIEVDMAEAERRVAAALAENPPKAPRVRSRTFPNDGSECGNYGMWRTADDHRIAVYRCLKALRPVAGTFDAIYCTGLSGTVPAAVVAHALRKDLLILRKQDPKGDTWSHGGLLEGPTGGNVRYMILDDFVSGGGTLRRLLERLPGTLAGIMLYGQPRGKNEREAGYAKLLSTYPNGEYKPCKWWTLVRRHAKSMLFDLVPQEDK